MGVYTGRRLHTSSSIMPAEVFKSYVAYLRLGYGRSLRRLWTASEKASPSIATLKRWSARYGWPQLAEANDLCMRAMLDAEYDVPGCGLIADPFAAAKQRFVAGVLIGPDKSSTVGGTQRRSTISVRDYIELLRLEHDLRNRPCSIRRRQTRVK